MNKRLSSNQDDFQRELRKKFFRIVEQRVSSFLPDLAADPYQRILLADVHEADFFGCQGSLTDLLRERATPAVDVFADALVGWAREYYIETDWMMRDAFQLLSWWKDGSIPVGEDSRGIVWVRDWAASDPKVFKFEFLSPDIYVTPINEIASQMDRTYQAQRKRFIEDLEEEAARRKAVQEIQVSDDHLGWLALNQCGKVSMNRIAEQVGRTRFAVMSGVNKAADCLGLARRKNTT